MSGDLTVTQLLARMDAHLAALDADLAGRDAERRVIQEQFREQHAQMQETGRLLQETSRVLAAQRAARRLCPRTTRRLGRGATPGRPAGGKL